MQEKVTLVNPLCFLSERVVLVDRLEGKGVGGRESALGCSAFTKAMAVVPTPGGDQDAKIRALKDALEAELAKP